MKNEKAKFKTELKLRIYKWIITLVKCNHSLGIAFWYLFSLWKREYPLGGGI